MKIVIVGGVAGGASAAARIRRLSEQAEIVLLERGQEPSFANCGLPYYIGGVITERDKLLVAPWRDSSSAIASTCAYGPKSCRSTAQRKQSRSGSSTGQGRQYGESYDRLILSPGASPIRPPLPGIDLPGIQTLRDLRDADRLNALAVKSRSR